MSKVAVSRKKKKLIQRTDIGKIKAWRSMLTTTEVVFSYLEKKLLEKGSNYPRLRILYYIYAQGPLSAAELAQKMLVSRANVSTFIKRLIEDKTVVECPETSRQGRPRFMLSEEGMKEYEKLLEFHLNNIDALPIHLDSKEMKKLDLLHDKVKKLLTEL